MVDFPIVDTHLHLWDPRKLRYPWLDNIPILNRSFLLEDYKKACGPVQVEKMVFLQCECDTAQYVDEVEWVTAMAAEDARIRGIVAWAPLEKGEGARAELEKLSQNRLLKGIRRIIQFEPDPGFCLRPDFVRGVRMLTDYNLSFDICIAHGHMPNTIKFVRQCPDVPFILDHIGKPDIKNHVLDPWREGIRTLAEMPNVCCKVSGLVTEGDHKSWTNEDLKPYIDHVVESFGFDRVIYGGDWPVAFQATEYPRWVETLAWAASGCSKDELRRLFHDNAIAFYRLNA